MKPRNTILAVLAAVVVLSLYLANRQEPQPPALPAVSQPAPAAEAVPQPVAEEARVPPFHPDAASARPFTKTLPPERFDIPVVAHAYTVARRIPEVLAQQPCYCWCDKFGHGSLLDCYATDHGAG